MKLLLSDGCVYHYPIDEIFEIAAKTGFDGIEIIWGNDAENADTIDDLHDLMAHYGISIDVIHEPFGDWKLKNWPVDRGARIPKTLHIAEQLNASTIVVHTAIEEPYISWQKQHIPELQKTTNIHIAVENMPEEILLFGGFIHRKLKSMRRRSFRIYPASIPKTFQKLLGCIDHRDYSLNRSHTLDHFDHLTMDTTHLGTAGTDILHYYEKLQHKIVHIHLSDFDGNEHKMPGFGFLPIEQLMRSLKQTDYQHTVTLEVNPRAFCNSTHKFAIIDELKETVAFLRSAYDK